jgi:4-diphosphocytidyl-2-C-methyl-D-erythritol kinase
MPDTLAAPAYAKINLCLSVGPPQPAGTVHLDREVSGFHKIASWMACVDVCDEVTITKKPSGSVSTFNVSWADDAPRPTAIDWKGEDDLTARAHRALEGATGKSMPVEVRVVKRIPVGGGFGGGSSDAATVLLMLNQMYELGLPASALREIAFTVGSDVAFFIDGGDEDNDEGESDEPAGPIVPRAALVSSFGEVIERADPVASGVILVIPPFACETRAVYRAFDELLAIRVESKRAGIAAHKGPEAAAAYQAQDARDDLIARRIEKALRAGELDSDSFFNDLFLPTVHVEPRVGRLVTALSKTTRLPAHLTGSGSGVFIIVGPGKLDKTLAKVRSTLDSLAAVADESESGSLAGTACVALATRLL